MKRMLKSIARLKIGQSALVALLICSTALASGCAGLRPFPTKTVWEADLQAKVCGEYRVVDVNRLLFKHIKDHPINKCDGVFGFSAEDMPKVLDWSRDAIKKCAEKCR